MSYNPDEDEDLEFTNPELHMSVDVSFDQSVGIDSAPVDLRAHILAAYQRTPDRPNMSTVATPKNKLTFENVHNTPVNHNRFFGKINDNMNIDPLLSNKIIKNGCENFNFVPHDASYNQPASHDTFLNVPFSEGMFRSPSSRSKTVDGAFPFSSNPYYRQPLDECTNQAINQSIQLTSNNKRKSSLNKNLFGKVGPRDVIHSELDGDVFHADSMPDFPTETYVEQFRFKRIFSVPAAPITSQLSKPIKFSEYKSPKAGQEFDNTLIGDWTRSYQLPVLPKMMDGVVSITPKTLSDILDSKASVMMENTFIIDCRYPYEYDGGHIKKANNSNRLLNAHMDKKHRTNPIGIK
ncbi:hypothetical protein MXB_3426 [Myxobolus squamalis]|nr:hypothetical protein MXB_3426 [Myxobolus squamalis]